MEVIKEKHRMGVTENTAETAALMTLSAANNFSLPTHKRGFYDKKNIFKKIMIIIKALISKFNTHHILA